jgi:hypothetical protein
METFLVSMKTLNLSKVKKEFLMLTAFHGHKFCDEINQIEGVEEHVKEGFRKVVREFMRDLFEMAEFDQEDIQQELERNSAFFNSVS